LDPIDCLTSSEILFSEEEVGCAIVKLANELNQYLCHKSPLVLSVMTGAMFLTGQLLPKLSFPLHLDYVQANRYHGTAAKDLVWRVEPPEGVKGKVILLLDDILDEGITLAEIKAKCLELGAKAVYIAVLFEKNINKIKPINADFVGLQVPDRYVFGCGMDIGGWWRNLPALYALKS
jgi:hypoxanthine phosphoribosyltransferase